MSNPIDELLDLAEIDTTYFASIDRPIYRSNNCEYGIYAVTSHQCGIRKRFVAIISGKQPPQSRYGQIELVGSWKHHPRHGRQFQVSNWRGPCDIDALVQGLNAEN